MQILAVHIKNTTNTGNCGAPPRTSFSQQQAARGGPLPPLVALWSGLNKALLGKKEFNSRKVRVDLGEVVIMGPARIAPSQAHATPRHGACTEPGAMGS